MMDELREYRFYADDMLHPSTTAIEYIWERFTGSMLSPDSLSILKEWKDIQKAINHKPFQPESEAYKRFISQTLLKMERINEKFPSFDSTKEMEIIKSKLNPKLEIEGFLLTMYDGRLNLTQQVVTEIKKYFPRKVFATVIPRTVRLSEAPSYGQPILYYDKSNKGCIAYGALADEILKKNR